MVVHSQLNEVIFKIAQAINEEDYPRASEGCLELQNISPEHPQFYYFQGAIASSSGDFSDAINYYKQALLKGPTDWPEVHYYLAKVYYRQGQHHLALQHFKHSQGYNEPSRSLEIAHLYFDVGLVKQAYKYLTRVLEMNPEHADAQTLLFFYLPSIPGISDADRKKIYTGWAERYYNKNSFNIKHLNDPSSDRRLRIGYISSDFRLHAAANNLFPLYELRDREKFEVFSYFNNYRHDEITAKFRQLSDHWCETHLLSGQELAEKIRQDKIDILVDCNGHTADNRLRALSLKPAPIQISAFGFVFTTGMRAFDYQFSDEIATPPSRAQNFTETMIHLSSQIHWRPLSSDEANLPLEPSPYLRNGFITFGSGNASFKHNEYVVKLWASILRQVPHSLLHLKHKNFEEEGVQVCFRQVFAQEGIDPARMIFSGKTSREEHMRFYNEIDIALDPFPYTGGMTTCETLYMGVPIIALDGDGIRTSQSLLTLTGVSELIANTAEEYIFKAISLARNPQRIQEYKQTLRAKMLQSPIMNGTNFTKEVESAYRKVWEIWCDGQ
jgi:protein O-GlcNAc transferase